MNDYRPPTSDQIQEPGTAFHEGYRSPESLDLKIDQLRKPESWLQSAAWAIGDVAEGMLMPFALVMVDFPVVGPVLVSALLSLVTVLALGGLLELFGLATTFVR